MAIGSNAAVSNIGSIISKDSVYQSNIYPPIHIDSSIVLKNNSNNIINNKGNWTELSFNFKANGEESYLYIGNFDVDSLVNYEVLDTGYTALESYYLIDNISLIKITGVGINEHIVQAINFYPNPAQNFVSIELLPNYAKVQLSIYSITGQLVTQKQVTQANQTIPITELGNGVYIFVVESGGEVVGRRRVVISK